MRACVRACVCVQSLEDIIAARRLTLSWPYSLELYLTFRIIFINHVISSKICKNVPSNQEKVIVLCQIFNMTKFGRLKANHKGMNIINS